VINSLAAATEGFAGADLQVETSKGNYVSIRTPEFSALLSASVISWRGPAQPITSPLQKQVVLTIQCTALEAAGVGFPNFQSLRGYRPLWGGILTQNLHSVAHYGSHRGLEGICGYMGGHLKDCILYSCQIQADDYCTLAGPLHIGGDGICCAVSSPSHGLPQQPHLPAAGGQTGRSRGIQERQAAIAALHAGSSLLCFGNRGGGSALGS